MAARHGQSRDMDDEELAFSRSGREHGLRNVVTSPPIAIDNNIAVERSLTFARARTGTALPAASESEVNAPKGRVACR